MLLQLPIRNEKASITRPIVLKVVRDLKEYLDIFPDNINIIYIDEEGVRKENGTATHELGKEGINTTSNPLITLSVTEEYRNNTFLQYQHYDQEFHPCFLHDKTQTSITPYYSDVEMRLNISYRAPSKAAARMWLNSIKSKIRRYRDAFPHNLEYSYEIPEQFIYALTEVYRLIHNQDKTIGNVSDWFQQYFIRRFGTASDSAGVNTIFVVSEIQQQVFGYFNFDGMIEEGDKADGATSWVVSFDYLLRYQKPTDISIWLPRTIYNQVLPDSLMGVDDEGEVETTKPDEVKFPENQTYYTNSGYFLDQYSAIRDNAEWGYYNGIAVPRWNEFQPLQSHSIVGLERFVDQLVLFLPEDKEGDLILDLNNPQGYDIDEDLKAFIVSEKDYMLHKGKSVFQLCVYENNAMLRRDFIKIDETGKVYLNGEIDISKIYNIRLGIYHDWKYLDTDAIDRLKKWCREKGKCHFFTFKDRYAYNECQLGIRRHPDDRFFKEVECVNDKYSELYFRIIEYIAGNRMPDMVKNNRNWGKDHPSILNTHKTVQTFNTTNISHPKER